MSPFLAGGLKVRTAACADKSALFTTSAEFAHSTVSLLIAQHPPFMTSSLDDAGVVEAPAQESHQRAPAYPCANSVPQAITQVILPDPSLSKRKNHPRKPDRSNRAGEAEALHRARLAAARAVQTPSVRQAGDGRVARPTVTRNTPHVAARTALEERRERPSRNTPKKDWQVSTSLCALVFCLEFASVPLLVAPVAERGEFWPD